MPVHSRVTTPSAFATGKTKRVPVKASNPVSQEDIFAQQYYEAADSGDKRIYNQIDLENKGGLVWIKSVGNTQNSPMIWMDSLQGVGKYWECGETYSQTNVNSLKSFNKLGSKLVLDFLLLRKLISQFCSLFKLIIFFKAITVPCKSSLFISIEFNKKSNPIAVNMNYFDFISFFSQSRKNSLFWFTSIKVLSLIHISEPTRPY